MMQRASEGVRALYASLAEVKMALTYITDIIRELLDIFVKETAFDTGTALPLEALIS